MPQSLAERLGFEAHERVAIVHADDIGMCHAANEGAFQALRRGPATCGSIMVPCPWFQEAAEIAKAEPEHDLGVHLTLNSEWSHYRWGPVAGRSAVPSLLDDQGYLPATSMETAQRAKPEEVEIELRAQVQMALDAGIDVTHLDSHMGTCFFPQFLPIYTSLAEEFQLPIFATRADQSALEANGLSGLGEILRSLIQALETKGFPVMDHFDADSLSFAPGTGEAHNQKRLAGLKNGINYLICHPAQDGAELSHVAAESAHQRDFERGYYGGEPGRRALEEAGIKTVGMRALRDLLRSGSGS